MNFENNKAIYEQMADRLCDEIIAGTYKVHCMYDQVNDIVTRQDKPEFSLSLVEYKDNHGEITKYIDMYEKNFKNIWT